MTGDLMQRAAQHKRAALTKDLDFKVLYRTDSYFERRGLEQLIYLKYSATAKLNHQNAVRASHALRGLYFGAAKRYLKRHGEEIPSWFK